MTLVKPKRLLLTNMKYGIALAAAGLSVCVLIILWNKVKKNLNEEWASFI